MKSADWISKEADDLWSEYAAIFEKRWGISPKWSEFIGCAGKHAFRAEFIEHDADAYCTSVILPIRNAWYSATVIDARWKWFQTIDLREPILDYGCGIGFTAAWLARNGYPQIFGYELLGVQHDIMKDMLTEWDSKPVSTVLCFNVLEHVSEPLLLLQRLMTIGKRVVANCCMDHDEASHIASESDLRKCYDIIKKSGDLYG